MIYTSYFAKYRGTDGVSIARYNPFWYGLTCQELAPSEDLLLWWKTLTPREQQSEFQQKLYTRYYKEQLRRLDPHELAKKLEGKVLLCYEKPDDFCHRHIVADWFNHFGIDCKEL